MKREAAIVRDVDGNEMFFGETAGECQVWCIKNNISGANGEYIAIGIFETEYRSFEAEDYENIDNANWLEKM